MVPRLPRLGWLLVVSGGLLCRAAVPSRDDQKYNFAIIGVPLSPLHSIVSIGQELCLRGHNVTVVSFDERGRKKAKKYSPICEVNYVSLGPLPIDDEKEQETMAEMAHLTNNTVAFMKAAMNNIFSVYFAALREPFQRLMASGAIKPDYALVSLPFGDVGQTLESYGVDFAINMPSVIVSPVVPYAAQYVPPAFAPAIPLHDMGFLMRVGVIAFNNVVHVVKHAAAAAGFKFSLMSDMNPALWQGRLVLINSIPGFDYPQSLPPLVQYTGPVMDLKKMEPFPPEVEAFLEETPDGVPVVYVSFGTVMYLSEERVAAMVNTLTSDRYRVLWALPKGQQKGLPAQLPRSMLVHHWVPTPRALAHPKVVAFVSHCGGNSAVESMAWGVPIVGYPQFGDQMGVCQRVADAGAGRTRPAGCWVQASDVLEVVTTPSYTAKAQALSRVFKRSGGVGRAADMMELGARGDLAALRLPTEQSWTAWFQLGGYETLLVAAVAAHAAAYVALRCWRCCCGRRAAAPTPRKQKAS